MRVINFTLRSATTFLLLFYSLSGFSQYTFDGNYDPCGGASDEYANADAPATQPNTGSSTCDVQEVYADIYNDGGTDYFIIGLRHGNKGQSNFRLYINSDCDATTGQINAEENLGSGVFDVPVGGADWMVNLTTKNNPTVDVYKWNGSSFVTSTTGAGKLGDACINGVVEVGTFVEVRIPVDAVFNPCDNNSCGSLELATIISNAGGSANSSYCEGVELFLNIPVNDPPVSVVSTSRTCDDSIDPADLPIYPTIVLNGTGSSDVNVPTDGDELDYVWSVTTTDGAGSFVGATSGTTQDVSTIVSSYTPTQPGTYKFTLMLTDNFACDNQMTTASMQEVTFTVLDEINTIVGCSALPVTYMSFDCRAMGSSSAEVTWSTSAEMNNDYFVLERRDNGSGTFNYVAKVAAKSSGSENYYSFLDEQNYAAYSEYRIRQVDLDGTMTYSNIIELNRRHIEKGLSVYSGQNSFLVNYESATSKNIDRVSISDIQGRTIKNVSINTSFKSLVKEINTSDLQSGIYLINVIFENGNRITTKAIKN